MNAKVEKEYVVELCEVAEYFVQHEKSNHLNAQDVVHNLIEQKAFPDNELFVYNRQGKLIYRFKNISKEEDLWSPSQTNSPTGTYFYRFMGKRHDKTIDLMGAIEVLR